MSLILCSRVYSAAFMIFPLSAQMLHGAAGLPDLRYARWCASPCDAWFISSFVAFQFHICFRYFATPVSDACWFAALPYRDVAAWSTHALDAVVTLMPVSLLSQLIHLPLRYFFAMFIILLDADYIMKEMPLTYADFRWLPLLAAAFVIDIFTLRLYYLTLIAFCRFFARRSFDFFFIYVYVVRPIIIISLMSIHMPRCAIDVLAAYFVWCVFMFIERMFTCRYCAPIFSIRGAASMPPFFAIWRILPLIYVRFAMPLFCYRHDAATLSIVVTRPRLWCFFQPAEARDLFCFTRLIDLWRAPERPDAPAQRRQRHADAPFLSCRLRCRHPRAFMRYIFHAAADIRWCHFAVRYAWYALMRPALRFIFCWCSLYIAAPMSRYAICLFAITLR